MDGVEASGKSVDDAISKALNQLGLNRDEVEVEIVSEGKQGGFLGFGGESARVLVRPLPRNDALPGMPVMRTPAAPPPPAETDAETAETPERPAPADDQEFVARGVEVLRDLLRLMEIDASVTARPPRGAIDRAGQLAAVLDVEGEDLGVLIGRRGDTLASLQYIVNLILSRQMRSRNQLGVDVEGYRRRREESLQGLARRMASRVKQTRQSMTLEPMPPNERRIIHITLADDPEVMTVSIGEGEGRKVAITPRR
jgi:spoIIIJ-associated protein